MHVLIWPTTFGADLWSFTKYLSRTRGIQVTVVMDDPESFKKQGVAELFPLDVEFVRRKRFHHLTARRKFRADVTLMDNRPPLFKTSPSAMMLWHGFGWKGPNDEKELRWLHAGLKRTWGDARVPNPQFRWQCFGAWDFEHRTTVSGFDRTNCRVLGAASHDDLRVPLDRERAQAYYPIDVVNRKTVLIAPTWHYGEVFAHWGTDANLFERLLTRLDEHDANVILRLHDSYRFDRAYRQFLEDLTARHRHVVLKFKDTHPDNYLDMQVADVLITNYSSIANLFYATLRPTVHVYPVKSADEEFAWRQYTIAGVREKKVESARYIWKLPPTEHGGLLAREFDELIAAVDRALEDPTCCADQAKAFLDKYMLGADGRSCERTLTAVEELVEGAR